MFAFNVEGCSALSSRPSVVPPKSFAIESWMDASRIQSIKDKLLCRMLAVLLLLGLLLVLLVLLGF